MKVWLKTFIVSLVAFTAFSLIAGAIPGCTKAEGSAIETVVKNETRTATLCVLQNIDLDPPKIAQVCGDMVLGDVLDILAQTPIDMKARLSKRKSDAGAP